LLNVFVLAELSFEANGAVKQESILARLKIRALRPIRCETRELPARTEAIEAAAATWFESGVTQEDLHEVARLDEAGAEGDAHTRSDLLKGAKK